MLSTHANVLRHLYSSISLDLRCIHEASRIVCRPRLMQGCARKHSVRSLHSSTHHVASTLYVNNLDQSCSPIVELDIDVANILKDKQALLHNIATRGMHLDVDKLAILHEQYEQLNQKKIQLEKQRQEIASATQHIKKLKKSAENDAEKESLMQRGRNVKQHFHTVMTDYYAAEEALMTEALRIPAPLHNNSHSADDIVLAARGETEGLSAHEDRGGGGGEQQQCVHFTSTGSYYLSGSAAKLERSIMKKAESLLHPHIHVLAAPHLYRHVIIEGSGRKLNNKEQAFYLHNKSESGEDDDDWEVDGSLCLEGVSLSVFTGFLMRRMSLTQDLPLYLTTSGTAYMPAQWCAGKRNLWNTHQAQTLDVFAVCENDSSASEVFNDLQQMYKQMYTWTQLPYRLVQVGGEHLAACEAQCVEYQVWMPSQQEYVKCGHMSQHGDYLSRRLMMCHTHKHDDSSGRQFSHTVYGRLMNVSTLLAAIMEHRAR